MEKQRRVKGVLKNVNDEGPMKETGKKGDSKYVIRLCFALNNLDQ